MRYEEERLTAAVGELKQFSTKTTDIDTLADLGTIIAGFQTMHPYVSVGLKVCPSAETLEAIDRLHDSGRLTQELWSTLMKAVGLARNRNVPSLPQRAVNKRCRRVTPRALGRSLALAGGRKNRLA